jgi:hypothetical protein
MSSNLPYIKKITSSYKTLKKKKKKKKKRRRKGQLQVTSVLTAEGIKN